MRRGVVLLLHLVVFFSLVLLTATTAVAPGAVANRSTGRLSLATGSYFGALVNPNRGTPSSTRVEVEALETKIGRKLDIVNHFYTYPQAVGTQGEVQDVAAGSIPMVTWGATDTHAILNGSQDAYIRQQATRLKNLGGPVFLRYYHEPEGAYRAPIMGSAADYIASWRRAHTLFQNVGATNVVWMFTTTAYSYRALPTIRPWQYYPGDDVVDWIAADGYNFAPVKPGSKWNTPATVFGKWYAWAGNPGSTAYVDRYASEKPLMIAEYGALEDPSAPERKAGWYQQLQSSAKASFPLVQGIVAWSTANTKDGLTFNWNVDSTASSLSTWKAMGADPYFSPARPLF